MSNSAEQIEHSKPRVDQSIFIPSVIVIIAAALALIFVPVAAGEAAQSARNFITTNLTWLYLLAGVGAFIFACWMAFGRYGDVMLGDPGETPEYSTTHWVAMMFTAGIGAGVVVWGFAEPIFYLQTPPLRIEAQSNAAMEWAHMYPLFHWGVIAWSFYVVPAVPIAYLLYVKKRSSLKISTVCEEVLPVQIRGPLKTIIDIIVVFGIIGGTATSLGIGIPMVSAFVSELLGVADTIHVKLALLVIWTLLFGASVYRGLKKGIKVLADINMVLAIIAILFVLIAGPTLFILNLSVNSLGLMFQNMIAMSVWTDPIEQTGFPGDWTVFYWAWWLAYAAFVGMFIGRISRGRTIRQLVVGVIGWGSLGTITFLAVMGGYSIHLVANEILPLSDILTNEGMPIMVTKAIVSLPFGKIVLAIFIVLCVIFYATSIDSAAFILASICSKNLRGDQEPLRSNRLIWAGVLALLSAGLVISGELQTVQSATIVSSLPLLPVIILMCMALIKWLREDEQIVGNRGSS
ncbi:MAG: BCCT family transporter [Acidimicrobiales bacterium]|nr:BCCT family transporter [Hyphomonadaceae bacterium]RZV36340.1 MAG: BCCT family transporter [Acidimicrobiales bacterium]